MNWLRCGRRTIKLRTQPQKLMQFTSRSLRLEHKEQSRLGMKGKTTCTAKTISAN
jgi:hypothetical protein